MLNVDIYKAALTLIAQGIESNDISDYDERAPYLIASFCNTSKKIDADIRRAKNYESQGKFSPVCLPLEDEFPLCDDLVSAASLYVAAMLVIDEDEALSDSIYDKYCDAISSIMALGYGVGSESKSIIDVYDFD